MKRSLIPKILTPLILSLILAFPAASLAASHTVTAVPVAESPVGTTYHLDFASLTAAGADTGTAYFDLVKERPRLGGIAGVNSSGQGVVTLTFNWTYATNIDSLRLQLDWGPTTSGPWTPTNTFTGSVGGANSTLLTATAPYVSVTVVPPSAGVLRIMARNMDATTSGLTDVYPTFVKRGTQ